MTYLPPLQQALDGSGVEGLQPAQQTTELLASSDVRVLDCRCAERACDGAVTSRYEGLTLLVAREGAFTYQERGYTRVIEPGAIVLGWEGDRYTCTHDYGGGDASVVFQFTPRALESLGAIVPRGAAVLAPSPRLMAAALPALGQAPSPEALEEAAYRLAGAVFAELDAGAIEVPPSLKRADRDRVHLAIAFIEAHAAEPIGLEAIAAAAATSPFHFLRIFRREVGMTPHQYLIRTRLRHAVARLRETQTPVTAIAYEVGFGDLSNFMRAFRRQLGRSPEAFRRGA